MTMRRSAGTTHVARALWYAGPGKVELRPETLGPPKPDEARVRTAFSGISRGTERLILNGLVGRSEWERMKAPLQKGAFPFPVKYGYCATGTVEAGPDHLLGRDVFCLHPHQDMFVAPSTMLVPLPAGVPLRRATLTANMETALNAHWDGGSGPGDRIVVVGAGVLGLLVAHIAARLPGAEVTVVDILEARRPIVESFGARFAIPETAPLEADIVFHTSASAPGLATAIAAAGDEATIVELSWYGDKHIEAPLGGPFHSRRLKLVSSQVGRVAANRRSRWDFRRRLEAALNLLTDPALDVLVAKEIAFADAAAALPALLDLNAPALAPVIRYR
ncbi:MAG: zinc-binding alcohol dehydrogenase [Pseudomonadota bacterium]